MPKFIKWTPKNIKALAYRVGASKLAQMLGANRSTLTSWIKGKRKPKDIYRQGLNYVARKVKFEPKVVN